MDPTAALQEWINDSGGLDRWEYREALANWMSSGGFTPDADMVCGVYWWCADNHSGQTSEEYAMLSLLSTIYKPGPLERGPNTDLAREVYQALEDDNDGT